MVRFVCVSSGRKIFQAKEPSHINDKDMTFTESATDYGLDFTDYSTHAAVLDYDLDGDLDVLIKSF